MAIRSKKYVFTYQTKNLVNGKTYVGFHNTDSLEDGYIGCGVRSQAYAESAQRHGLKSAFIDAVVKHGYINFKIEVLSFFDTVEEAMEEEEFIVNRTWVERKDNYNISVGGKGGYNPSTTQEEEDSIFKDYMGGLSKKEVCEKHGIGDSVHWRIVRDRDTSDRKRVTGQSRLIKSWLSENGDYYIDKYKRWQLTKSAIASITPFDLWRNDFLKGVERYPKYNGITPEGDIIIFSTASEASEIVNETLHHAGIIPVVKGKYKQYKGYKFYNNATKKVK